MAFLDIWHQKLFLGLVQDRKNMRKSSEILRAGGRALKGNFKESCFVQEYVALPNKYLESDGEECKMVL